MPRILKKILKILLWISGSLLFLLLMIILLIQVPAVQNYIAGKATGYLSGKIKSKVELQKIEIVFPKKIHLKGLYVEDQSKDTLLWLNDLYVDVSMFGLLSGKLDIGLVDVSGLKAKVRRLYPDTAFNYSFIPEAFASKDTVKTTDTSGGMKISLGRIQLSDINLSYSDTIGGIDAKVKLGSFSTSFRKFDLDQMIFNIGKLELANTNIDLVQSQPLDTSKTASNDTSKPIILEAGIISLINIKAHLKSHADTMDAGVSLGSFSVKDAALKNDTINFSRLLAGDIFLAYDKRNKPAAKAGMDFNHLLITGLKIDAGKTVAGPGYAKLSLNHFSFREKSGFLLKDFRTNLVFDSTHTELAELDIQTGNSRIRSRVAASYPSLSSISDSLDKVVADLVLDRANLSMKDVLYFMPELAKDTLFGLYGEENINITGKVRGSMANLVLEDFDLNAGNTTRIRLSGSAKNLMKTDKLYADVQLAEFTTSRDDIIRLVPKGMIPQNIRIPSFAEADGYFRGFMKNFNARFNFSSSAGGLSANIVMGPGKNKSEAEHYKGVISLDELDVGYLMKQDSLRPVSLTLNVDGSGFDTATINTDLNLLVKHIRYNRYDYHDFRLTGNFSKMAFDGTASMQDSNLMFSYKGLANLDPKKISADFTLYLKGIDMRALHLSENDQRFSGTATADLKMAENGNILGKFSLANLLVIKGDEKFPVDSINLTSTETNGITDVNLKSSGIRAGIKGTFLMKEIGASVMRHLNNYFKVSEGKDTAKLHPEKFDFYFAMIDPTLTQKFVPSIQRLTPFEIKGNFDSERKELNMNGDIKQVTFSGMTLDSLKMSAGSDARQMTFSVTSASVFNEMIRVENFALNGTLADDKLAFSLKSEKPDSGMMIALSGNITNGTEGMKIVLDPAVTLSAAEWIAERNNYILFGKEGMVISKLSLSNGDQLLSANSRGGTASSPLDIKFQNFDIAVLSKIIEKDTQLVRGTLNGIFSLAGSGFTSDLNVKSLTYRTVPVGDIRIKASEAGQNVFDIGVDITGNENDISLAGKYTGGENDNLDAGLDIRKLAMKTVEPFTSGQVTRISGTAGGNIKINGSTKALRFDGRLNFNDFAFAPKATGTYLKMDNNSIIFSGTRIQFQNMTLTDSLNNKAVIDGYADVGDFSKISFDMTLKTRNFLALNTKKAKDQVVFGKILLDSDIHLTGTQDQPVVAVKVRLNKGTDVTFVNPANKAGVVEYEGIVVFVDSISRQHPIMTRPDSAAGKTGITEMNVNATIEIDENALLKMMIDPAAGDSLYVKGSGVMDFTLDPSGTMSLTGRYTIKEGGYHLTVSGLIKRDFKIKEGSSVTWNGDIMDAEADITAIYNVETSPLLLVENQLSGADDQQKNKYRNDLRFQVLLMMSGVLKKPEIHFDIDMDPKDRGAMGGIVYGKLGEIRQEEQQLNKQVFALLTLNRFIGEDPLESGGAPTTVSSAARSSASKLLTDQLNNLAERYVKNVDLHVGVKSYEDYSTGQAEGRTELQLGLSKELLQGRLVVQVGGSIDVEGQRASENNLSDIAGDISIEYKLTDDGRYRLKGFRTNAYENPIEGELTRTGVGFLYTRDFNRIKDLYQKQNKLEFEKEK